MSRANLIAEYLGTQIAAENGKHTTADSDDDAALPLPIRAIDVVQRAIDWRVKDFLLAKEYAVLGGDGGSYKSTIMFAVAGAVAGGYPVLNAFPVAQPHRVLIVSEEDPEEVIRNRLDALIAGHGWDPDVVLRNIQILALGGAQITELQWQLHITHLCAEHDIGLVCFDPLADLLSGENAEKDNEVARPVIRWFRQLGKAGHTPLVVAHVKKANQFTKSADAANLRGASAWANGSRVLYYSEPKDGSLWLTCGKMSRTKKPEPRELTLTVDADPENHATWHVATLGLSHPPGDWKVPSKRDLSPSEKTALTYVAAFDEPISYSRWEKAQGVSSSALALARRRLVSLDYVRAVEMGMWRGKPRHYYEATEAGRNALI